MRGKGSVILLLLAALVMALVSCTGDGNGSSSGSVSSGTTTIAGRVALSSASADSTVTSKSVFSYFRVDDAISKAYSGEGSVQGITKALNSSMLFKILFTDTDYSELAMPGATIQLFDAEHPQYLYPVAEELTGPEGEYKFTRLKYATQNAAFGATYSDDDPIPAGRYTLIASKYYASSGKLFVAVQPVIKSYEGEYSGNDLVGQASDVVPQVVTMFGMRPNGDGTFGGVIDDCDIQRLLGENPPQCIDRNAKVMVTFNMAMARGTVAGDSVNRITSAISIVNSAGVEIVGQWKLSPDLLSAFFTPEENFLSGEVYSVTIAGGKDDNSARNVYGRPIPARLSGTFVGYNGASLDAAAPQVRVKSPEATELTDMPVYTPIRIASSDLLDMTSFEIRQVSGPSLGDKPNVVYVGQFGSEFVYEIVPSMPIVLGQQYRFDVVGGMDLANNMMNVVPFEFTVETADLSDGIDLVGTDAGFVNETEQSVQVAAKNVFGKWVRSMNDRSTALLTPYMAGDFAWIQNGTSSDDLNRDGRLSLGEFSTMLQSLIDRLEGCQAVVTPDINGSVNVTGTSTADLSFALNVYSNNTTDPMCEELTRNMPQAAHIYVRKINGAWLITHGADYELPGDATIPRLEKIELVTPFEDESFEEPTEYAPLKPTIRWMSVSNVATYAIVIADARDPFGETGWVALYNGSGIVEDTRLKIEYTDITGGSDNLYILSDMDGAFRDIFGFQRRISKFKPGGDYLWAVVGLDNTKLSEIRNNVLSEIVSDVIASSTTRKFYVDGTWKEITVSFDGATYEFSPFIFGYDVGDVDRVYLKVKSPSDYPTTGNLMLMGYGQKFYPLAFDPVTKEALVTLDLYNKRNFVYIEDNSDGGEPYIKSFTILTTGGEMPVVEITQMFDNTTGAEVLRDPVWGNIYGATLDHLIVNGTVSNIDITSLNVDVWGNNGYYSTTGIPVVLGEFSISGVPVYDGYNRVKVSGNDLSGGYFEYSVDVEVLDGYGAIMLYPIEVTIPAATETFRDPYSIEFDAGVANTAIMNVTMDYVADGGGWDHFFGSTWNWGGYGYINSDGSWEGYDRNGVYSSGTSIDTLPINLYQGENTVRFYDNSMDYNWREIRVVTTGGIVLEEVFSDISVTPNTGTTMPLVETSYNYRAYSGDADSVSIRALTSVMPGTTMYYDHYYDGDYDYSIPVTVDPAGYITIPVSLYTGYNEIWTYDPVTYEGFSWRLNTTGGVKPPRYLDILNPKHNDYINYTTTLEVWAFADAQYDGYLPTMSDNTYVCVTNLNDWSSTICDDLINITSPWTMVPMPGYGTDIRFDATFNANEPYEIYVEAYDPVLGWHGAAAYINNNYGYDAYFYKAGAPGYKSFLSPESKAGTMLYKKRMERRFKLREETGR